MALLVCLGAAFPTPGLAQDDDAPPVRLSVTPGRGELGVQLGDLLRDGGLRRAIHQGLPLRISVQAELWQDRFFDSQRGEAEWRASVVYDPVGRNYRVEVQEASPSTVGSLDEAGSILRDRLELPLAPAREGRFYYLVEVEMETLSLSDLEELQRWLRGDLAPAVSGENDMGGAVGSGVRRLFVRALGLPARRIRLRTPTFEIGGGEER